MSASGEVDGSQSDWVLRVRHRTLAPDSPGSVRSYTQGGPKMMKVLVWFWIIDETLMLTSILSVCRLNEVGTCQVLEQVMIMVMMVMTTR